MPKIKVFDSVSKTEIPADLVFAFTCKKNKKVYVALDYKKNIFEKNSSYNNLDLMEIIKQNKNIVYVSEIKDEDWNDVKYSLQFEIFSNIKKPK